MIILDANLWIATTSTVEGSSEASALPATMSQIPERTAVWRSLLESGEQYLDCDFGAEQTIDTVAVANRKLLSGGVLKLQSLDVGSSPPVGTDLVTIPTPDDETSVAVATFTAVSVRHVRLLWTNPGSVLDYAEVGFVGVGEGFVPEKDLRWEWSANRIDPSVLVSSPGGQITATQRAAYSEGAWTFRWDALADIERVRVLYRRVGTHTPFFFAMGDTYASDERPAWLHILGRLRGQRSLMNPSPGVFDAQLDWEEAR